MLNQSVILRSIVIGNQTIIMKTSDPSWFPTIWLIIVGVFMVIVFCICLTRHQEHTSNADSPIELSRILPNYCNTNGSAEIRGDSRHDHGLPNTESLAAIQE